MKVETLVPAPVLGLVLVPAAVAHQRLLAWVQQLVGVG